MGNVLAKRPRVVLVTGVSRPLGARLSTVLQADPAIDRVIGVDAAVPQRSLGRTEFVRADVRTPAVAGVIDNAGVDTVVHAGLSRTPPDGGGGGARKDVDVVGTMQLLAACQRSETICRLVVRSTAAVYGASPDAPALFTEEMEPVGLPRRGYARDAWEAEAYVRGFARRRPDVSVTTLRFANVMGRGVDSAVTRYFTLPAIPTVLGFDPRMQFVHEDDALEALRRVTLEEHPGTFNVSGEGVMVLSQAIRRAGRPALPVPAPAARNGGGFFRRLGIVDVSPEQIALLSYGRAIDASALTAELGSWPAYSTLDAFDDFVRGRGLTRLVPVELVDRMSAALAGTGSERGRSRTTGQEGERSHGPG